MHLIHQGLLGVTTPRIAWRVSFVPPAVVLLLIAGAVLLGEDTPRGPWATRNLAATVSASHNSSRTFINPFTSEDVETSSKKDKEGAVAHEEMVASRRDSAATMESGVSAQSEQANSPPSSPPSLKAGLADLVCWPTLMLAAAYAAAFGASLAINSILVPMYMDKFSWSESRAGYFSALVGCLNVVSRPSGGLLSDVVARRAGPGRVLQAKKCESTSALLLRELH